MIYLLKTALGAGHQAKYVLFDSCFSNPKQILDVKELGLNEIAMVKRSSKRNYIFEGKQMNIKKIFASCKKQISSFRSSEGRPGQKWRQWH